MLDITLITKSILEECIKRNVFKKDTCKELNIPISRLNKYLKMYNLIYPYKNSRAGIENPNKLYPEVNREWLITHWINTTKSLNELADDFN